MIGWNPGNEDEIFNLNELIEKFDISRIIKVEQNMILKKQNGSM